MENVKLHVVRGQGIDLPEYRTDGAAGMDVRTPEDVSLHPMERKLIPTGLRVAVPFGYELQLRPRSGLALRQGLSMANTPGTVDSDYRGEIGVLLINLGQELIELKKGERIAQMVVCPVARADWVEVSQLDETHRAEGGFGSTGT